MEPKKKRYGFTLTVETDQCFDSAIEAKLQIMLAIRAALNASGFTNISLSAKRGNWDDLLGRRRP
jgi:hypothetical protein